MSTPTTTPFPLGRRKYHDPRNIDFPVGVLPKSVLNSIVWPRRVPIFDQGSLGSCTGNAAAGWAGTDCLARLGLERVTLAASGALLGSPVYGTGGVVVPVDEDFAVRAYGLATQLDSFSGTYPPTDTGSDGPSAAKALTKLGVAGSYWHAFSIAALQSALQSGPVMWGTVWYNSMFDLDTSDYLVVKASSGEAGGHELLITGWDKTTDVYRVANSWASTWGDHGYFYVKAKDMKTLLAADGDLTQPVALPVAPVPAVVTDAQLYTAFKAFQTTAQAWVSTRTV